MSMSSRDRKLLWGKAANRCAICETALSQPESEAGDPESVLGDEAHIIGEKPGSARYRPLDKRDRDAYGNRILLCPNHHREIDTREAQWPTEKLRRTKESHEAQMERRTSKVPNFSGGLRIKPPKDLVLESLLSGRAVGAVVGGAHFFDFDYDPPIDEEQKSASRDLIVSAQDWGDIWNDIGAAGHFDAEDDLNDKVLAILGAELLLFGAQTTVEVFMGEENFGQMQLAVLRIRRPDLMPTSKS